MNINELRPVSAMSPVVSTKLELPDKMGAVKVRLGIGRDHYSRCPLIPAVDAFSRFCLERSLLGCNNDCFDELLVSCTCI